MKQTYINENKFHKMGNGYETVTLSHFENQLGELGYNLFKVTESRVRNPEFNGFQKHIARFRSVTQTQDGLFPEIIIVNDHMGRSCVRIMAGLFRVVCTNGLVTGTTYESINMRHVGNANDRLRETLPLVVANSELMMRHVDAMSKIELTQDKKNQLAQNIINAQLKNVNAKIIGVNLIDESQKLLTVQRRDDNKSDLFTVTNIIQENLFQQGIKYQAEHKKDPNTMRHAKTKVVKDGTLYSIRTNQMIWDEALKFAA